mmetsp:Transcript_50775/g.132077  ORF Transcript_50775/g.132077 Transcript_50775/m.132077 type:complete len:602 (-) Transcript_50775:431-2236(-)
MVARGVGDDDLAIPHPQAAGERERRALLARPSRPQRQLRRHLQDVEGGLGAEAVGEVRVAARAGVHHVKQRQEVSLRQIRGRVRVVNVDGLGRAADGQARELALKANQRREAGVVALSAGAVLIGRHHHVRKHRVHKVQLAVGLEGDPVLLRPRQLAAPEKLASAPPRGVARVHPAGQVHLRHGGVPAAPVPAEGRVGAERHRHLRAGVGVRRGRQEDLWVLGPRDHQARQGLVLGHPSLSDAQVRPAGALRRPQPSPGRQLGQLGRLPGLQPLVPVVPVEGQRAEDDVRVPGLLQHGHVLALVRAPGELRLAPVPTRGEDHAAAVEEQGGVDEHRAAALVSLDRQPHVHQPGVDLHNGRQVGAACAEGRQEAHAHHRHRQGGGRRPEEPVIPARESLGRLLHGVDRDDGGGRQEQEEGYARPVGGPQVPADELQHIHRVRVPLQEVQSAGQRRHHGRLRARQPRHPEQHEALQRQQHAQARGQLRGWHAQRGAAEDAPEPGVAKGGHDLHEARGGPVAAEALEVQPQAAQQHAQHEDVQVAEGVELQEDHRDVQSRLGVPKGVVVKPERVGTYEDRHRHRQPRERKRRQDGAQRGGQPEA